VTKIYYLDILRASEGTLRRWARLYLQSLAPTNPHWAGPRGGLWPVLLMCKEGLCPSSGDINRLMMMMMNNFNRYSGIFLPILGDKQALPMKKNWTNKNIAKYKIR
jgi:hypothetical protein